MVDKSPNSLLNSLKKKNNPFKKILDNVKKLVKKDDEKDKKPSSFEAPKKGRTVEDKKSRSFESSKKGRREKNRKPSPVKGSKKEKGPELNQQPENSKIQKKETSETEEADISTRESKGKVKEQKLPKKFRKGW
jgi:hypothetical protein